MDGYRGGYIVRKIIENYEKKKNDWNHSLEGRRSLKIHQEDFDRAEREAGAPRGAGRDLVVREMLELERLGLIPKKEVRWQNYKQDFSEFHYYNKDMPVYYKLAGKTPKYEIAAAYKHELEELGGALRRQWLRDYVRDRWREADSGKLKAKELSRIFGQGRKEQYFACLKGLDELEEPVYVQIFSSRYLGRPKIFREDPAGFRGWVVQMARDYHSDIDRAMDDAQVLSWLYIEEYSQQMEVKGPLRLEIEGQTVDLGKLRYGTVLNSETLKNALICREQDIRRIVTIENRASFVCEPFEEETLYVFTHGFLSPKERDFLKALAGALKGGTVEYLHSGDMDFGGLRIFCFIRDNLFPDVRPLHMNAELYRRHLSSGYEMEPGALRDLEKMSAALPEELEELRQELLKTGKGLEQEMLLI